MRKCINPICNRQTRKKTCPYCNSRTELLRGR